MAMHSVKTNALLNVTKQCCTIIFPLITFPYVSRVLGVDAYGQINYCASIVAYITLIAGLGVSNYAVREGSRLRDDKERFEIFANQVFSINIVSTVLAYAVMAFMLVVWGGSDVNRVIIAILSFNVLFSTLGTDWVNTIYEDFAYLTIRYIVCQGAAVVLTLLFIHGPQDIYLYAFLQNLGTLSANLLNVFYIRHKIGVKLRFTCKMDLGRNGRPIMLLFGNMVASTIYINADTTMLGFMAGDIAVGYYAVASKIYSIVKQLVNAISNVLVPRLSNSLATGSIEGFSATLNKVLGLLVIVLGPLAAGLACTSGVLVSLLSGDEYAQASLSLSILSAALVCASIACLIVSVVMLALRMDKQILFASTLSAIINIVLNLVMIPVWSYNAAAFTTFISELTVMVMGFWYTRDKMSYRISREVRYAVAGAFEVVAVSVLLSSAAIDGAAFLVSTVLLSIVAYAATLWFGGIGRELIAILLGSK